MQVVVLKPKRVTRRKARRQTRIGCLNQDCRNSSRRLLMSMCRLYALVQTIADCHDSGRVLAAEFMELPNRKLWPSYYKLIKRPRSFEMIFVSRLYVSVTVIFKFTLLRQKRLKRREYETPLDFANDVELIFSNALEFNQEHTQIWDDAIVLRVSRTCKRALCGL